jgi:NADH-quinone oxidoreductase subunit J
MLTSNSLFMFFSYALVFSSIMVIIAQHPVFSLLFLVSCFIFSSFLLFLLECEFIAFLFIVVYVGAIAILFLFAIMMLESKLINLSKNAIKYFPIGIIFSVFLLLPILNVVDTFFFDSSTISGSFYTNNYQNWYDLIDSTYDVNVYGQILYSYFALQFLIAGLILLVVLIGVVSLTNSYDKQTKQQSTFRQLSRTVKIF